MIIQGFVFGTQDLPNSRTITPFRPAVYFIPAVFKFLDRHSRASTATSLRVPVAVNDSRDFETVIRALADCGYVGFWRVLNAQYFGVPQQRRRVFLVEGYRRMPPIEFLADAAPVDAIPPASRSIQWPRPADAWATNTLLANKAGSQITMGCTTFVAHPHGWDQMAERQRASEDDGFCLRLDAANLAEAFAAGNAVVTQVAEWVGRGLIRVG
ncbi:DNA cytosine methyltransferase [Pseudomonas putida]|uniref:DNA cytosine methyltransferase n=1 Tax=Pseudomonas putida TaxID=303 RepID=UPI00236345F0|nr:DNA cytosine methyltransferase [Pseudomonas putida]MDD2101242.1 DNA cytosine methyltransferase [Pseudomonas putida]